jgi:hypothetical protein
MSYNSDSLFQALGAGGELTRQYEAVWQMFWRQQPYVPAFVLELCRLRLAQLHGADAELGIRQMPTAPAEEAKIQSLLHGSWLRDEHFSSAELAAIEFAEIYGQDPNAVSDDNAEQIKLHFGESGLVCLIEALGFIDGRIRLALVFSGIEAAGR